MSESDFYEWSSERHGLPVLNAAKMTPQAKRFEEAFNSDQLSVVPVLTSEYEVDQKLRGYTVLPTHKVTHRPGDKPGEFDGSYLAEEYHGLVHPILLVPSDKVTKK